MDTEATAAQYFSTTGEGDPRKIGRPPPIVTTSTTNLIRTQSDLKGQVKNEL
jgi:hypothetical protein